MIRGYVVLLGLLFFSGISGCSVGLDKKIYGSRFYVRHSATSFEPLCIKPLSTLPPRHLKILPADQIDVGKPVSKIKMQLPASVTSSVTDLLTATHRINPNKPQREANNIDDGPDDTGKSNIGWFAAMTLMMAATAVLLLNGFFVPLWMIGFVAAFWLASLIVLIAGKKVRQNNKTQTGVLIVLTAFALIVLTIASYILWHAVRLIIAAYEFFTREGD